MKEIVAAGVFHTRTDDGIKVDYVWNDKASMRVSLGVESLPKDAKFYDPNMAYLEKRQYRVRGELFVGENGLSFKQERQSGLIVIPQSEIRQGLPITVINDKKEVKGIYKQNAPKQVSSGGKDAGKEI